MNFNQFEMFIKNRRIMDRRKENDGHLNSKSHVEKHYKFFENSEEDVSEKENKKIK